MKRPLCLLIEDDLDDQEIFRMALDAIDGEIKCVVSNNGVEALETLQLPAFEIPDYIFLDVNMPKMNGVECLKEIRKLDYMSRVKIFMYSTTSEKRIMDATTALGADGFIIKPAGLSALEDVLRNALKS